MKNVDMSGVLVCARYAFAPNFYHYCGPETHGDLGEYLKRDLSDPGLVAHLTRFETLYPYLQAIAFANGIKDPLNQRVVQAYWIGNELLERIDEKSTYEALVMGQKLPKKVMHKEMQWLLPKIDKNARLHHSFHVFNIFTRTGHHKVKQTTETMDSCRISWGRIATSDKQQATSFSINSQKLVYEKGKLRLVPAMKEVININEKLGERLKPGDWVSCHWGFLCDKLSEVAVKHLEGYTRHHLKLANETI